MFFAIKIQQGTDYEAEFTATNPDTGAPINLTTGYAVDGKVGKTPFSVAPWLYEWNSGAGNVELLNGSLKIKVPGAHSRLWSFERVFYSIMVVNTVTNAEIILGYGPVIIQHTLG